MAFTIEETKRGAALARKMGLNARVVNAKGREAYIRLKRAKGDDTFYPSYFNWKIACNQRSIDMEYRIILTG